MKLKILSIFGTRPETIKMAPIIKELSERDGIENLVCVTAQHREMLDQVLDVFQIKPKYDLNIMKKNQDLSQITINVLLGITEILKKETPNLVLVHGDTTTTFASALAAFYQKIPVGHIEAGLRTYEIYSPFPEELNRQMVSNIADIHFAPTLKSKKNLLKEGKKENRIFVTGNTAIDALKMTIDTKSNYNKEIIDWVGKDRLIILTAHRRENQGNPMYAMFNAIRRIVKKYSDVKIVFPVHPNPLIIKIVKEELEECENIKLIPPLDVISFHNLLNRAYLVLTDSGGLQEEAPALGKPVIVLRDTTERPEGILAGTLRLAGTNENKIFDLLNDLLSNEEEYKKMSSAKNPYGDGFASKYIVDAIIENYAGK